MHVVGSMLAGSVSRIMKYLKERRPTEEGLKVWDIVTRHRCLVDLTTLTAPAFPRGICRRSTLHRCCSKRFRASSTCTARSTSTGER